MQLVLDKVAKEKADAAAKAAAAKAVTELKANVNASVVAEVTLAVKAVARQQDLASTQSPVLSNSPILQSFASSPAVRQAADSSAAGTYQKQVCGNQKQALLDSDPRVALWDSRKQRKLVGNVVTAYCQKSHRAVAEDSNIHLPTAKSIDVFKAKWLVQRGSRWPEHEVGTLVTNPDGLLLKTSTNSSSGRPL